MGPEGLDKEVEKRMAGPDVIKKFKVGNATVQVNKVDGKFIILFNSVRIGEADSMGPAVDKIINDHVAKYK